MNNPTTQPTLTPHVNDRSLTEAGSARGRPVTAGLVLDTDGGKWGVDMGLICSTIPYIYWLGGCPPKRKETKMSMRELEASILAELKQVAKNSKIRQKDIMEWSTGEVKAQEGETYFFLPNLKVHVCVKLPAKKTAQQSVQRTGEQSG